MQVRWLESIFDHKVGLRERMFRLATGICMIALICILPMGRQIENIFLLIISLIVMGAIMRLSIKKECINAGGTTIAILLLLLFPSLWKKR